MKTNPEAWFKMKSASSIYSTPGHPVYMGASTPAIKQSPSSTNIAAMNAFPLNWATNLFPGSAFASASHGPYPNWSTDFSGNVGASTQPLPSRVAEQNNIGVKTSESGDMHPSIGVPSSAPSLPVQRGVVPGPVEQHANADSRMEPPSQNPLQRRTSRTPTPLRIPALSETVGPAGGYFSTDDPGCDQFAYERSNDTNDRTGYNPRVAELRKQSRHRRGRRRPPSAGSSPVSDRSRQSRRSRSASLPPPGKPSCVAGKPTAAIDTSTVFRLADICCDHFSEKK